MQYDITKLLNFKQQKCHNLLQDQQVAKLATFATNVIAIFFFLFTTAAKTCLSSEPWMTKLRRSAYKSTLFHHRSTCVWWWWILISINLWWVCCILGIPCAWYECGLTWWGVHRVGSRYPHHTLGDCGMHSLRGSDLGYNYLMCATIAIAIVPPNDKTNHKSGHNARPLNWKQIIRNWAICKMSYFNENMN